jgi:hypothetical protein
MKYYIHDDDGYTSIAEASNTLVTITRPNGIWYQLKVNGDKYTYSNKDINGKVRVVNVPEELIFELPILVTLLAKHTNLMSPVTIVEAGKITKLFQED